MFSVCYGVLLVPSLCLAITKNSKEFLKLENQSESQLKGCYFKNNSLALCFDIQPAFLALTGVKNQPLVRYQKLPNHRFQAQVMDENYIWHRSGAQPLVIKSPNMASASSDTDSHLPYTSSSQEIKEPAQRYQSDVEKLRGLQQVRLLPRLLQQLHDIAKDAAIMESFQVMSFSLLAGSDDNVPAYDPETIGSHHRGNKNRGYCEDLRNDPYNNKCLGMCGPNCWCWSLVCGDCCFHKGCYQHDLCCGRNKFSGYCLLPFFHQFKCKGFGGYPDCLSKP
ncbi:uncharacterized protein [Montipora capricornis]|uniref:uncharacterized protein n=1 Tax=Montipora capricornis TaxID=246305 RepID=UPI0035F1EB92